MANPYGKTRQQNDPYATYKYGSWTWKVLKLYQSPEGSKKNPYARAFCAVSSDFTQGGVDLGDVYLSDIQGTLVQGTDVLKECGRR
jgi:hypothetical protein